MIPPTWKYLKTLFFIFFSVYVYNGWLLVFSEINWNYLLDNQFTQYVETQSFSLIKV